MNKSSFIQILADYIEAIKSGDSEQIAHEKCRIDEYLACRKFTVVHNYASSPDLKIKIDHESFSDKWRDEYGYLPLDDSDKI